MRQKSYTWELIITVNSPGEVSGWLTPVLHRIREEKWDCRVTIFVPPCPFASGAECRVVRVIPGVDLVAGPAETLSFLLFGKRPRGFTPLQKGAVLFLGGELAYAAAIARRLKYPAVAYTEGVAGWSGAFARFAVPYSYVADKLLAKGIAKEKIRLVGNLMLDAVKPREKREETRRRFGVGEDSLLLLLMPGSRPAHFEGMLPFFLRTAELVVARARAGEIPRIKVAVSLSPFITDDQVTGTLQGDLAGLFGITGEYHPGGAEGGNKEGTDHSGRVVTGEGLSVTVVRRHRYNLMSAADLALTIPGTNTMELSFLGTPMVVSFPLLYPERIPLEGWAGLLGGLPVIGKILKRRLIPKILEKTAFTAWPNRLAGEYIVPEIRGEVTPEDLAGTTVGLLQKEEERKKTAVRLRAQAGETGAARKLTELVLEATAERYGRPLCGI